LFISIILLATLCCGRNDIKYEAEDGLRRALAFYAERQYGGGWATAYSIELNVQWGEWRPVAEDVVAVQPPGTPEVGLIFLKAAEILDDRSYMEIARAAGDLLIAGQQPNGGFSYELQITDSGPIPVIQTERTGPPRPYPVAGSLEDGVTDRPIEFLLALHTATGGEAYFQAARKGVDFMVAAQYETGGWPQRYPPAPGSYQVHYTLNDGAITDTILRLLSFYGLTGEEKYLTTAEKGGKWLLSAVLPDPTPGWAEQYDLKMKPASARPFEPPAVCSETTGRALTALLELYLVTGDKDYLSPIPETVKWLESCPLADDIWARLYDSGDGEPMFVTRYSGDSYNDVRMIEEWSIVRWYVTDHVTNPLSTWRRLEEFGREGLLSEREKEPVMNERERSELAARVRIILSEQRPEGFWINAGRISCRTFTDNAETMMEYLRMD
jgi:hypothetical protein